MNRDNRERQDNRQRTMPKRMRPQKGVIWNDRTNSFELNLTIFVNMSEQNFEYKNAMARLEEILSKIDNSEMEIDELALEVQEATQLLRKCRQILISTEKNVQEALAELDA